MTRLSTEIAGAASLEVLAALHAANFAEPWDRDSLEKLLALPGAFALIAVAGERPVRAPVGLALCRVAGGEGELLSLAVMPAHRRQGAGRALLAECIHRGARMGAGRIFLEVARDNVAARRLYDSFGFVEVGERPGYYRQGDGDAATALTLRLDLDAGPSAPDLRTCET